MVDVRKCHAARKVADALSMRNGPLTDHLSDLPLNSEVIVFREGRGWSKPCRLIGMDGQTCQVELNGRPTNFRSTVVKPFHRGEPSGSNKELINSIPTATDEQPQIIESVPDFNASPPQPRRSARLAHHKVDVENTSHEHLLDMFHTSSFNLDNHMQFSKFYTFFSEKEKRDRKISLELRAKGIITTSGTPFELSRKKEMDSLLEKGVFEFVHREAKEIGDTRIFGSRMVDEVKGKGTATPYEKSRLVIQAFNDQGKKTVLTQSPTIQRVSQRLILAIAPSLAIRGIRLFSRDITQAYVQSKSKLARPIYASPPREMGDYFPRNKILKIIRPLYGIPESGTHWFKTYHNHHLQNLEMQTSTYDPCLLVTKNKEGPFGIVGLQTDDSLILGDSRFIEKENFELGKAKLIAKPIESLAVESPLLFNGCKIEVGERYEINL
ncbi:hypothetical protein K3495_g15501, partial [Podosphaera aphanis]